MLTGAAECHGRARPLCSCSARTDRRHVRAQAVVLLCCVLISGRAGVSCGCQRPQFEEPLALLFWFACCSLSTNLAGPTSLLEAFTVVQQQLREAEGDDGHLATWLAGQQSMQETAAEIDRLLQVCVCDCVCATHTCV